MTKIYLIRHAEAEGNLYRRIHGHYDSLITELGRKQIEALKTRFEHIPIDAVYSSDLTRTRITASAIYVNHGLPLHTTTQLREVNLGIWEDVPWGNIEKTDRQQLIWFNSDPARWVIEGREPFEHVQERIARAIREIAEKHDGQTVAVVSHGAAIRSFLCMVLGYPSEEINRIPHFDNTAVTLLTVQDGEISVDYMGDTSHLTEELSTLARQKWWRAKSGINGGNLRFVPFDPGLDEERYLRYRQDAWRIANGAAEGFRPDVLDAAKHRFDSQPGALMLALQDDTVTGLIELDVSKGNDSNVGEVAFTYMEEPYRGTGLAIQLLGHAVSVYRALGRKTLRLETAAANERAVRFYRKSGFEQTGEETGAQGPLIVLEKDISKGFNECR